MKLERRENMTRKMFKWLIITHKLHVGSRVCKVDTNKKIRHFSVISPLFAFVSVLLLFLLFAACYYYCVLKRLYYV